PANQRPTLGSSALPTDSPALAHQRDLVAPLDHTLDQNRGINASLGFTGTSQLLHDLCILLPGVRIECYHLAAGIAIGHDDGGPGANAQGPAHEGILVETSTGLEVDVDIRAKTALVQAGTQLLSHLPSRVDRK